MQVHRPVKIIMLKESESLRRQTKQSGRRNESLANISEFLSQRDDIW